MFTSPYLVHAQVNLSDLDIDLYHQVDGSLFLSHRDTLYQVDVDMEEIDPISVMPSASIFGPNRYPTPSSAVVSDSGLWMWDRSVGTAVFLRPDESQKLYPLQSTGSRFSHAATTRPDTGEPLVFGGYGNFRAKDFFLFFDTKTREWREISHQKGEFDPKPQKQSYILDIGNGRDVYLIQGFVSNEELPPLYDKIATPSALIFDFSKKVWSRTRMNEEVACLITTPVKNRQFNFRGEGLVYGGLLFPTSNQCSSSYQTLQRFLVPHITFWRPETSEWASYPVEITFPTNRYPIGFVFDDNEIGILLLRLDSGGNLSISIWKYPIPESILWSTLPKEGEKVRWIGILVALIFMSVMGLIGQITFRRVFLVCSPRNKSLIVKRGLTIKEINISQGAATLLAFLLREGSDQWRNRSSLEQAFLDYRYEQDTLRTVINRAINDLNTLSRSELGVDMILRRSSENDKRMKELSINPKCRVRLSPEDPN